jgi:hypothetical protein
MSCSSSHSLATLWIQGSCDTAHFPRDKHPPRVASQGYQWLRFLFLTVFVFSCYLLFHLGSFVPQILVDSF